MFQLTAIKDKILPDIDEAVKQLKAADEPDLTAREIRPLMAILVKMSESVPRLRGHILTRRTAISAFGWKLKPYDSADRDNAIKAERRLRRVINQMMNWHTDVPLFGAQAVELNWVTGKAYGTTPEVVNRFDPTEVERTTHDPRKINILLEGANLQRYAIEADDPKRWLASVDESQLSGGILRSLIFHEILLNTSLREWSAFNLKLKGLIQAKIEEWASDEDKTAAAGQLRAIAKNNYSLTSKAVEYVYTKITDAAGSQSFKDFKGELEADRAITILGQANTSQLPDSGGSRAALQVLKLISADIHYSDMNRFEGLINEQLLLWDFQLNAKPNAESEEIPWHFEIDLSEERDAEKHSRIVTEYLAAGIAVRTADIYEPVGLSLPEPGEDVIAGKTQGGMF
jgi:phage gp29-like protein